MDCTFSDYKTFELTDPFVNTPAQARNGRAPSSSKTFQLVRGLYLRMSRCVWCMLST